ncbi:hypothetical protein B0H13DRAFT_2365829 [Mycena leptocephala]|nr:hypothetical protein B0H13DRAFT_2365829 [Mycena leptocephala]
MLINGGFVYLAQTPVPTEVVDKMVESTAKFLALPSDVKDAVDMNDSAHFNRVSHEEGTPEYHKIHGSTPWPDYALFPGCRAAIAEYYCTRILKT